MTSAVAQFVRELWGPEAEQLEGCFTIWVTQGRRSAHLPIRDALTLSDDSELHELNDDQVDIYFGLGLRESGLPPSQQGGRHKIVALPGFMLDLDIADPVAHKAKNLPSTTEDVQFILSAVDADPSKVVHSGHGLQVYYLFDRPLIVNSHNVREVERQYEAFQRRFIDRGAERGWQVDLTATVNRVWRLPGFKNWKRKPDYRVAQIVYRSGLRYPAPPISSAVLASVPTDVLASQIGVVGAVADAGTTALEALRDSLRRRHPTSSNQDMVLRMLNGESIAPAGQRDHTMQKVCSTIVWMTEARQVSLEHLVELFRPSLRVWALEPGAALSLEEELQKCTDKLRRARRDLEEHEARQKSDLASVFRAFSRGTPAEQIYAKASDDDLTHLSIVQKKNTYWVYDFARGRYSHALTREELATYCKSAWIGAPPAIDLTYVNAKGERKEKTFPRLLADYAVSADDVVGNMIVSRSYFDIQTRVFWEASCSMRPLEPEFDPQIDHWMRLLGGRYADKLLDWVACVTTLERPCAALYMSGRSGAGKGMLALGLSRLWRESGPTEFQNIAGDYTSDIMRCPLIFLDEGSKETRRGATSTLLRQLVAATSFGMSEKYVVTRQAVGSCRIIIAANNNDVVSFTDEQLTAQDLEAVASRFLHIPINEDAVDWLNANNEGRAMTNGWVDGDGIARHALWLRDNRAVKPGKRFLVEGELSRLHRQLILKSEATGLVVEWLARYLAKPQTYDRDGRGCIIAGGGCLYVNAQGIVDAWEIYSKENRPSIQKISRVLARFSQGQHRLKIENVGQIRYWKIDPDIVISWALDNQVGNEDTLMASLERPLAQEFDSVREMERERKLH